jgi:hypothetical protein
MQTPMSDTREKRCNPEVANAMETASQMSDFFELI